METAKVDLRVRSKVEGQSRTHVERSTSCPGHILGKSSPHSDPVWLVLHACPAPRAMDMLMNPEHHRSGTPPTCCSSGRENRIAQDCERILPELRPEVVGQRSIDAVDLENEVSSRGSSWP